MVIGLGAALLAAVVFGVGAVVQAIAARRGPLVSRLMALVVVAYVVGWLLHLVSIALVPLYLAQVGISASLAVTARDALPWWVSRCAMRHWLAIAVLVAGLGMLALAAGPVGHHRFDDVADRGAVRRAGRTLVLGLGGDARRRARAACSSAASAAWRTPAPRSPPARWSTPPWTGRDLAAGAHHRPVRPARVLALLHRPAARMSVIAASAPLDASPDVVPAVVGVLMFDDGFRAGWWPVAVVGFVASIAAVVVLSDVGPAGPPRAGPRTLTGHEPS